MLTQNYFSIDSLSNPSSHDQYSESRFKQQPSAFDKSRTLKLWKNKNKTNKRYKCNQLSPSILARNKISYKWWPSGPIPLSQKNLEEFWGKEKRKKKKLKQNRTPLKNLLQSQLSMECILVFRLPTHAEHQKLGLSLSPILSVRLLRSHWGCLE